MLLVPIQGPRRWGRPSHPSNIPTSWWHLAMNLDLHVLDTFEIVPRTLIPTANVLGARGDAARHGTCLNVAIKVSFFAFR